MQAAQDFQSLFALSDDIYLLNHSVGRMPASTREVVEQQFFSVWQHSQPDAWSGWFPIFEQFTASLAKLFNSDSSQFCPQQNISSAVAKVLGAMPQASKDKNIILMSKNDFPSVGFVMSQLKRNGYDVRYIPEHLDIQAQDTWQTCLTEDVACALITHVHYNTNKRIPVEQITRLTRARNIMSIVDIAQSAGIVPIDLQQWQADCVVGSCVKWLCGGSGAGFLWLSKDVLAKLEPTDVGWFSHQNPFEFNIDNFVYADNALRFWGGTPSVVPFVIANNSIRQITSIGPETINAHNQRLLQPLIDVLDQQSIVTPTLAHLRGGTLVVNLGDNQKVRDNLAAANIMYDERKLGARFSPHIYNTEQQMEVVIRCLTEV